MAEGYTGIWLGAGEDFGRTITHPTPRMESPYEVETGSIKPVKADKTTSRHVYVHMSLSHPTLGAARVWVPEDKDEAWVWQQLNPTA